MALTGPYGCLDRHPTAQSIKFNGRYINLKEIARLYELDHGYLSRIFNQKRVPSIAYAKVLCRALHMHYADFILALGLIEGKTKVGRTTVDGLIRPDKSSAVL